MADRVDSMSDAELRTKLAEHGFPVMPITASTRNLLVKKLKLVLDNKSKPRNSVDSKAESRKTLAKYSSGEESDLDTTTTKEKRGRRATTGGAMLPPSSGSKRRATPKKDSPVKRDSDKGSESEEEKSPVRTHEEVETVTTRRVTRTYAGDKDDYETGSDSDVDVEKKPSAPYRSNSRSSNYISSTFPSNEPSNSPPKTSVFSRPSLLSTNLPSGLSSADNLNSIRSRLGLTSTLGDRPSGSTYTSDYSYRPSTTVNDEVESPFISNFSKRLSALKVDATRPSTYLDRDTTNGTVTYPRRSYITGVARSEVNDYKTTNDNKFLKNNIVSLALVAIVALFFFCLFFMYLVKRNDINSIADDQNSIIPICQLNIPSNKPGINCVAKDQVGYAKDLLKVIHPELTRKTADYKCGKPGAMPYLTSRETLDLAASRAGTVDMSQCRNDLNNLQVLILNNPRWGLSVVHLKSLYSKEVDYSALSVGGDLVRERNMGSLAIALTDASTPLYCLLLNALYSAGSTLILIALLAASTFGVLKIGKLYVNYQRRKTDEINSMVEQIIDVISQETEDSGEPYISVDQVRDTLISLQNREKMASVWNAAVKFIQRNESRVRMEVQQVDGEDCRVWRWISTTGSPKRSTVWQGQAFETQEGSVNNVPVAPTPCLKIRHMFDKNDTNVNLMSMIQDAILEKCGERCNILHMDLDRSSCCVYVKCASSADAGVVYRSLHGWWYEGHLITVKYLRLERYMQRFPNSPVSGPYLKPTRQQRSSWDE